MSLRHKGKYDELNKHILKLAIGIKEYLFSGIIMQSYRFELSGILNRKLQRYRMKLSISN